MSRSAASAPTRPTSLVFLLASGRDVIEEVASALAIADTPVEIHVLHDRGRLDAHLARVTPDIVIVDRPTFSGVETLLTTGPLAGTPTLVLDDDVDTAAQHTVITAGARAYLPRSPHRGHALREAINAATRRPALDRKLEETQRHFHSILEASSDGIMVLVDGSFQYVNSAFAAALGYDPAELREFGSLVAEGSRQAAHESLGRIAMSAGARDVFETVLMASDGRQVRFEIACRTSTLDGRRAVVGVARDVTAVRELQGEIERSRQRAAHVERLRALGELAAGVAHDFNNALEAILGRITMARAHMDRGESAEADIAVIEAAAKDAVETVKRIREFTRPSHDTTWSDCDLGMLARTAFELVRSRAHGAVKLDLDVQPTLPVRGNAAELREVIMNLVSNAFDAVGERGSVIIRTCQERGAATVIVEDDGPGMAPELQRRIFEPFFSTKGEHGTGLGLSVSQGILRRHDAHLEVDSALGAGSRFRMVFAPPPQLAPAPPLTQQPSHLHVLVVDDDPNVADLLRDVLGDQGHDVGLASSIGDALAWLEGNRCDVLVTDLDLRGTSGWKLARRVRETHPNIVIGLITGWPLGAPDGELKARGVDFVLTKPFTADALLAAIARRSNG